MMDRENIKVKEFKNYNQKIFILKIRAIHSIFKKKIKTLVKLIFLIKVSPLIKINQVN